MRPVDNPAVPLFCLSSDCLYHDESWHFKANGGDDVVYRCPKCNTLAGMHPPIKGDLTPAAELKKEIVMNTNKVQSAPLLWILGNRDNHTVRVVEEDQVQQIKDFDILIPMLSVGEIAKLSDRPAQAKDFERNLESLIASMEEGILPVNERVNAWLDSIGLFDQDDELLAVPIEDQEQRPGAYNHALEVEEELGPSMPQEMIFQHGFAQGLTFMFGKKYEHFSFDNIVEALDLYERMQQQNQYPPVPEHLNPNFTVDAQAPAGELIKVPVEPPPIVEDEDIELRPYPPKPPKVDPAKIQSRVALLQRVRASRGKK